MPAIDTPFDLMHDCRDVARINAVVNDPSVRPFIGEPDAGEIDFAPAVAVPANLFPFGEHGGFALIWTAPFTYEVHTFILASGRGAWARRAAKAGIDLAKRAGARLLWTRVPRFDWPHIRLFATGMGMTPTGECAPFHGVEYDVLSMEVAPCQQ